MMAMGGLAGLVEKTREFSSSDDPQAQVLSGAVGLCQFQR